jgi:hypothetical protein
MNTPLTPVLSDERVITPEMVPVFENVNVVPLLDCPPTVTTTGPVVALLGTGTTIAF